MTEDTYKEEQLRAYQAGVGAYALDVIDEAGDLIHSAILNGDWSAQGGTGQGIKDIFSFVVDRMSLDQAVTLYLVLGEELKNYFFLGTLRLSLVEPELPLPVTERTAGEEVDDV